MAAYQDLSFISVSLNFSIASLTMIKAVNPPGECTTSWELLTEIGAGEVDIAMATWKASSTVAAQINARCNSRSAEAHNKSNK